MLELREKISFVEKEGNERFMEVEEYARLR